MQTLSNTNNTNTAETSLDFCKPENIRVGVAKALDMLRAGKYAGVHRIFDDCAYACSKAKSKDMLGLVRIDVSEFSEKVRGLMSYVGMTARIDLINRAIERTHGDYERILCTDLNDFTAGHLDRAVAFLDTTKGRTKILTAHEKRVRKAAQAILARFYSDNAKREAEAESRGF